MKIIPARMDTSRGDGIPVSEGGVWSSLEAPEDTEGLVVLVLTLVLL